MTREPADETGRPWKTVAALVLLAGAGVTVWWMSARGSDARVPFPAICTQCGAEQTTRVGDAPGQEDWPRECPQCHAKRLYMARKCPKCGKLVPFKDPNAEQFGQANQCPSCKRSLVGS
jgi:DNA-directed RNA polymerase subunit RPC12/RpoP